MKISIIVPIYNVEKYLRQCIESIILQSYKDIEVLLINDESPDNSVNICEEYVKKYSYITLINKRNGGLSDARNIGILNATGDYIMFLDSDDYWEVDFLSELVKVVKLNENAEYVFFRNKCYYEKTGEIKEIEYEFKASEVNNKKGIDVLSYILDKKKNYPWYACRCIVRKNLITENNLFFQKGRNYEDVLWTPKVLLIAQNVGYYNSAPYVYRLGREGQITASFNFKNLSDKVFVSKYWYNELPKYDLKEGLYYKLMCNLAGSYFVAIRYAGLLDKKERRALILLFKDNKFLLDYQVDSMNRKTAFICRAIGFNSSLKFFKVIMNFREKLNF